MSKHYEPSSFESKPRLEYWETGQGRGGGCGWRRGRGRLLTSEKGCRLKHFFFFFFFFSGLIAHDTRNFIRTSLHVWGNCSQSEGRRYAVVAVVVVSVAVCQHVSMDTSSAVGAQWP